MVASRGVGPRRMGQWPFVNERPLTLLGEVICPVALADEVAEGSERCEVGVAVASRPRLSSSQKLVIFTEHRDTLNYLCGRIAIPLGRQEAVVTIHGGEGAKSG